MKIEQYLADEITAALKKTHACETRVVIEKPRQEAFGDFATTVALGLAKTLRMAPRNIADSLLEKITDEQQLIEKITVDGPGFINFTLKDAYWQNTVAEIVAAAEHYGADDWGQGKKINIEFVSANPTGPLNVVSARAAATGDVLVDLLNKVGFSAEREYYVNDAGRQIRLLGASVAARYMTLCGHEESVPEDGYQCEYIVDLARSIKDENGDRFVSMAADKPQRSLAQLALKKMIAMHQKAMENYRVNYQTWFFESSLREKNAHFEIVETLKAKGLTYEKDGALWFKSSEYGDAKARVVLTKEGEPTYFMVDIAYNQNKFVRGFSTLYDLWGPDHHGYIDRVSAALQALGHAKENFNVRIIQQVNMQRDGQLVKMSKRAGNIIEMNEVVQEVGIDAARFFFVMRKLDSPLDFDIDLVKKQDSDNPVYYVQYAHARICSVFRKAGSEEISLPQKPDQVLERLVLDEELALIRLMAQFPSLLGDICKTFEPHRLTYYLTELASAFHRYFNLGTKIPVNRIVGKDRTVSQARLFLAEAIRIVLYNGLSLLGIHAPVRM